MEAGDDADASWIGYLNFWTGRPGAIPTRIEGRNAEAFRKQRKWR